MARPKAYVKKLLVTPFQRFIATESAGGIVLIIFTILALIWANSPLRDSYSELWTTKLTIGYGDWGLSKALLLWINDGLMCIFFFLVGLEIKREVMAGELSSMKQASLPFFAALGGMLLPALVFIFLQGDKPGSDGWGIPMATDIAFSLGILSLLGKRVPLSLKIFLTAFAIVDDIGAVLVIAIFYSAEINIEALLIGLGLFSILIAFNLTGIQSSFPYLLVGIVIWYFFLKSGLHPTIAGIMAAFTIPIAAKGRSSSFVEEIETSLQNFKERPDDPEKQLLTYSQLNSVEAIHTTSQRVQPPLQKIERSLHTLVAFFILPVFALANSGVILDAIGEALASPLTISIAVGLVVGKTAGIGIFSWVGIKLKFAQLPGDFRFQHLVAVGMLGGVGFTMALFIANLAFTDALLLNQAKAGILLGSTIAGLGGYFWLRATLKDVPEIKENTI